MSTLSNRHALITGGGSGIGAAIAEALHGAGARVTLVGRREDALRATTDRLPGAGFVSADIAERGQVEAGFAKARDAHGPIEILVNNAGIAPSGPFAQTVPEDWHRVMAVNAGGVFHCCQCALPDLLAARHGRIVTVASTAGLKGYAYTAAYVASKHAAVGLMRALAAEYARTGLTANAVCPGFTDTDITAQSVRRVSETTGRSLDQASAALKRFNPQNRLIAPAEVARAVLWLCEPESQAFNGLALPIAGGEI